MAVAAGLRLATAVRSHRSSVAGAVDCTATAGCCGWLSILVDRLRLREEQGVECFQAAGRSLLCSTAELENALDALAQVQGIDARYQVVLDQGLIGGVGVVLRLQFLASHDEVRDSLAW